MGRRGPILVSGATGLVGRRLVTALLRDDTAVRALSRDPSGRGLDARVEIHAWNGRDAPRDALAGARAVVHLAGEPVFAGLLTAARRHRIRDSRVASTRSIAEEIAELPPAERPDTLICASAVGVYGSRGDDVLDETSAPGEGFLADICAEWEAAAGEAAALGVRTVSLRIGIVLAREGGALPSMALPFRLGLGARLGDGDQWFPWIHADDLVALVRTALEDERYRGPINAVAPEPVTNAELTRALGRVLRRPLPVFVPAFVLRLALGDLSAELLGSRRVVPGAALEAGFAFGYTAIDAALRAELG